MEFERWFSTEDACRTYLKRLRWPEGFICPRCGYREAWETGRGLLHCRGCGADVSVTTGTIFHRSHIPLRLWFRAMWGITNQKSGISAAGLQRTLGFGSYRTAWTCLHKLRHAMVRKGRDRLKGKTEVDETFIGGVEPGAGRRRLGKTKALVAIAAEAKGRRGIGRIRLKQIPNASETSLLGFIKEAVAPGALVVTDGWPSYQGLTDIGYAHRPRVARTSEKDVTTLMPRVHRVAALLKRWLLGIHQGRVSHIQLGHYLDEFAFRFNRRKSRNRGKLFYRLVQQAVMIDPVPYRQLAGAQNCGNVCAPSAT